MSRRRYVRWIGVASVALGLAAAVSVAGAARWQHSALDEVEGRHREPEVETVVLRFAHIPAESFVETLDQLARNPHVREHLEQMPLAVNEPANAVVLIAPPEVADMMRGMAEQLDQPNEFRVHEWERDAEEAAMRAEMEERERHLDRESAEFELEMDRQRLDLQRQDAERHRHEQEDAERHRHEREEVERHRHEQLQRLENEQRNVGEMFERHRQEAEQHLKELDRKRHQLEEEHRRRMEEFGDRLAPAQREAHERALHEHMKDLDRAREEVRRSVEEAHRQLGERLGDLERKKHEMMREPREGEPRPEKPRRREPDRPELRRREGDRPRPEGEPQGLGRGPVIPGLGRLLTPGGREALGLSDEQVEQITNLVRRLHQHMQETFEGIRDKMRRAGPEDRQRLLREMKEKMAGRWGEHHRAVMDRLAEILRPDQHERLKEWMGSRGPGDRPGPREPRMPDRPRPDRPRPDRPREAPRGFHRPSGMERPAGCRLL